MKRKGGKENGGGRKEGRVKGVEWEEEEKKGRGGDGR